MQNCHKDAHNIWTVMDTAVSLHMLEWIEKFSNRGWAQGPSPQKDPSLNCSSGGFSSSLVVKDLRLKDKDLMSKDEDKDEESSFKDKDLHQH